MASEHLAEIDYDEVVRDEPNQFAVLFRVGAAEVWVPRSQILEINQYDKTFTVPQWWAEKNELV